MMRISKNETKVQRSVMLSIVGVPYLIFNILQYGIQIPLTSIVVNYILLSPGLLVYLDLLRVSIESKEKSDTTVLLLIIGIASQAVMLTALAVVGFIGIEVVKLTVTVTPLLTVTIALVALIVISLFKK